MRGHEGFSGSQQLWRSSVLTSATPVRGMNAVYGVHALLTLSTVPRTQQRVLADTVDTDGDEPNACVKIHTREFIYVALARVCRVECRVVVCAAACRLRMRCPESALVCYILLVLSTNICLPGLRAPAARRAQRPCQPALSFPYWQLIHARVRESPCKPRRRHNCTQSSNAWPWRRRPRRAGT